MVLAHIVVVVVVGNQEDGQGQQVGAQCSDSDAYGDCVDGSALVVQAETGQEYLFVIDSRQVGDIHSCEIERCCVPRQVEQRTTTA